MMSTMYNATKANITAAQYEDITTQPPADMSNCTVANALTTNANNLQYQEEMFYVNCEAPGVLRIVC